MRKPRRTSWLIAASLTLAVCSFPKPASAQPPSLFVSDRARACAAFADRFAPSMKDPQADIVASATNQCMGDKRITRYNYACLMGARSRDAIAACLAAKPSGSSSRAFVANKKSACSAYAHHVIELYADELRQTATKMCMSSEMTEATFDCVMQAQTDAAFKHCLGRN
jgi:hypothetical protein